MASQTTVDPAPFRWFSVRDDTPQTPTAFTYFSLVHVLSGTLAYHAATHWTSWSFATAFAAWYLVHLTYEIKDMVTSYVITTESYHFQHSVVNTVFDHLAAMTGFVLAHAFCGTVSVTSWIGTTALFVFVGYVFRHA